MGHHLQPDGRFRSDKYEWCPPGFFALKFTDPKAQPCIMRYANLVRRTDPELAEDLFTALNNLTGQKIDERVKVVDGSVLVKHAPCKRCGSPTIAPGMDHCILCEEELYKGPESEED